MELLKKILNGYGTIGNDHPIAPSMRYYASELPQRAYDADKAKFHLKKAGLQGHAFKLHASDGAYAGALDSALLIRESAAKAGIDIQVVREPNDGYWTAIWRKKPWCFCYWSGRATADMIFSTAYSETASWNDTHWKNAKFNALLKAARSQLDAAKRREMYVEMQRIVRDEGGTIVHLFADQVIAATTKLKIEEPMAGHLELDGCRGTEKWWFAS
jgi:peptide/nickel transport system substrate-binding protein